MNERFFIVGVAAASIAIVAIGLRVGAGDEIRAAIVIGAPPPREGGRIAWQVRTQDDDFHTRVAAALPISVTLRARGTERVIHAATNVDGVAEIAAEVPDLAYGDRVELDVRDEHGGLLARGVAAWPAERAKPKIAPHAFALPTRSEGALRMRVAVFGGELATGQPGHVWIATEASGEPPRNPKIEATPDLGLDVVTPFAPSKDPLCARAGLLELVARGHIGGVALHAKDDLGREGDWYGSIPIGAGAMHVVAPLSAEKGPVTISITSASARTLAYVELDDDDGRAEATALPLAGEPPHADVTFHPRSNGRSFVVVSGEPDGATTIGGATRAIPIWIGPDAPCESDLAEVSAQAFPRFVALDGFVEKKAILAARRKRGRMIALGALALGSLLETLLLLRAAREGRRRLRRLQAAIIEGGDTPTRTSPRTFLDIVLVLMMSLLGFVLLFALVEWTSR
jgi:hypothetical protein